MFSLYISHYGGPQNFRVVLHLPSVTQVATDYDITPSSEFQTEDSIVEKEVPERDAKSYRLSLASDIDFINSGSSPILVSNMELIVPDRRESTRCETIQSYEAVPWKNASFVVLPGQIISTKVEFNRLRDKHPIDGRLCFGFLIVDRSGEQVHRNVTGVDIYSVIGVRFTETPGYYGEPQPHVLLETVF
jgi:hypothetical protein